MVGVALLDINVLVASSMELVALDAATGLDHVTCVIERAPLDVGDRA